MHTDKTVVSIYLTMTFPASGLLELHPTITLNKTPERYLPHATVDIGVRDIRDHYRSSSLQTRCDAIAAGTRLPKHKVGIAVTFSK